MTHLHFINLFNVNLVSLHICPPVETEIVFTLYGDQNPPKIIYLCTVHNSSLGLTSRGCLLFLAEYLAKILQSVSSNVIKSTILKFCPDMVLDLKQVLLQKPQSYKSAYRSVCAKYMSPWMTMVSPYFFALVFLFDHF